MKKIGDLVFLNRREIKELLKRLEADGMSRKDLDLLARILPEAKRLWRVIRVKDFIIRALLRVYLMKKWVMKTWQRLRR